MNKNQCLKVGYIAKSFGNRGDLVMVLEVENIDDYSEITWFFIDIGNEVVPFLAEQITIRDDKSLKVKFEDIDTPDQARQYSGCGIFLPVAEVPEKDRNKKNPQTWVGFSVIDQVRGLIGEIDEIIDQKDQLLLSVKKEGKQIYIPAVDTFIKGLDNRNRTIVVNIPDELISLNM